MNSLCTRTYEHAHSLGIIIIITIIIIIIFIITIITTIITIITITIIIGCPPPFPLATSGGSTPSPPTIGHLNSFTS